MVQNQPVVDRELLARITCRPDVFGGKPIIRDMRISVEMILDLLDLGETQETILAEYTELEPDDIRACLATRKSVSKVKSNQPELVHA